MQKQLQQRELLFKAGRVLTRGRITCVVLSEVKTRTDQYLCFLIVIDRLHQTPL